MRYAATTLQAKVYLRVLSGNVQSLVSSCGPPLPGAPSYPLEGIHIVPTPHPDVTHHLTPTYTLTPAIATSLISAVTLVKPDWLNTLLADRKSTRLNSSHSGESRMPSSA